ncbi:MAG: DUF1574 family protein [Planctomycetota bacterium]
MRRHRRLRILAEVLVFFAYLLILDRVVFHLPVKPDCKSQNPYLEKIEPYSALQRVPDVLYMGSSRIWTGVIPSLVSEIAAADGLEIEGYNLGSSATTPVVHYKFLRDLVLPRGRPQLIILEVAAREFNRNNGRSEKPLFYLSRAGDVGAFLTQWPSFSEARALVLSNVFVSSRRFRDIRAWIQGKKDEAVDAGGTEPVTLQHEDGWLEYVYAPPVEWSEKREYWRKVYLEEVLIDYEIAGLPDYCFRRLLDLAAEKGIAVKLVNMPVTEEQMEFFSKGEYETYIEYLRAVAERYKVELIDYNTPDGRPPMAMFHDTHHLNTDGARFFSKAVAADVVIPFFASRNVVSEVAGSDAKAAR